MNVDKVRQLLALCEKYDYKPDEIHLNNLTKFFSENASQVAEICKTTLASLTAEPVGSVGYAGNGRYEFLCMVWPVAGTKLYTAPPAQLLRPVELPDCAYGAVSHMSGGSKDYCNGFVDGTNNAIKAIREAGYEVKND